MSESSVYMCAHIHCMHESVHAFWIATNCHYCIECFIHSHVKTCHDTTLVFRNRNILPSPSCILQWTMPLFLWFLRIISHVLPAVHLHHLISPTPLKLLTYLLYGESMRHIFISMGDFRWDLWSAFVFEFKNIVVFAIPYKMLTGEKSREFLMF